MLLIRREQSREEARGNYANVSYVRYYIERLSYLYS